MLSAEIVCTPTRTVTESTVLPILSLFDWSVSDGSTGTFFRIAVTLLGTREIVFEYATNLIEKSMLKF